MQNTMVLVGNGNGNDNSLELNCMIEMHNIYIHAIIRIINTITKYFNMKNMDNH